MAGMFGDGAGTAQVPQELFYDDWGTGSNVAVNNPAAKEYAMGLAAQQLAAQGIPPPAPGSLQQMMNDPTLRQMMMGAIQGTGTTEEDLARLRIAAGKQGAYVQVGQGAGGRQFEPTVPGLYEQAAKRRGRPPLGQSLRGGQ